ncbi:MAG TPA: phasin [Xanthobacteraceae bacterium]|nr:phasin [Xanthobacteraceae bacterium]
MSEATGNSARARNGAGFIPSAFPQFTLPRVEFPKFEVPGVEMPAAFRDIAEKSIASAKTSYEKMKTAAEEATDLMEDTYSTASKGMSEYGLKAIEAARANTNAAFDFMASLMSVKSLSEAVELSTAHARKQFDALSEQTKELGSIAQKVATNTAEPIKESVTKACNKAA